MLRDDSGNGAGRRNTPRNVLGDRLELCSLNPMTGFFRDGCCDTGREDVGSHTICAVMTAAFLAFSKSSGNDLSTLVPEFGFRGLKPGDHRLTCTGFLERPGSPLRRQTPRIGLKSSRASPNSEPAV